MTKALTLFSADGGINGREPWVILADSTIPLCNWSSKGLAPRGPGGLSGDGWSGIANFVWKEVHLAFGDHASGFDTPKRASGRFGSDDSAGGWYTNDIYPREMADMNGDGRADVVGFGYAGVYTALGQPDGTFGVNQLPLRDFGFSQDWYSNDLTPRKVADVNGDGRPDIVVFAQAGVYVALANADGSLGPVPLLASSQFGSDDNAGGWYTNDIYPREMADVNGDGRADIVGFKNDGVHTALGQLDGTFDALQLSLQNFGHSQGWTRNDLTPRKMADVNGDGRADIVGFKDDGVHVALGNPNGTFGPAPFLASGEFGASSGAGGWTSNDLYPREVADVNGDGRADIVGFKDDGVYVALGSPTGSFGLSQHVLSDFGYSQGWTSDNLTPRRVADVNGDGHADIVGFKEDGVYVALGKADSTFFGSGFQDCPGLS